MEEPLEFEGGYKVSHFLVSIAVTMLSYWLQKWIHSPVGAMTVFGIDLSRMQFYILIHGSAQGPSGGIQALEPVSVLLHPKYIPGMYHYCC